MGKDYLVEGARLMCVQGGIQTSLRVPMGHGYTSDGKKKANCGDCLANANIKCFGSCKKNEKTHLCEGYMLLADKWEMTVPGKYKLELINGREAITMDSVLICQKGGLIIPVTSGQGYEPGLNMTSYLRRYINLLTWAKGRNLLCHVFGKDPINMNTGNFIYEKEDLVIPGIRPLSFKMFYNAMEEGKGLTLGEGWHHNHEQRLNIENQQTITLCQGDGREIPYRRRIGDLYSPVFGDKGLLKKEGNGYRYCSATEEESYFDETGRLTAVIDKNGNRDTYSYNETGLLEKITGANGGTLTYYYNKEQKLIQVNDHTGREIRIWYRYGKRWKFINVSGHTYTYAYNANGKLESVLTPRGIRGFLNEYDGVDRVLKQTLPDGGVAEFRYDDENLRTYMLEQNGNLIWYQSDERSRNIKTVYPDGEERYEYNDKNQRTRYIDKNGNKTTYRYDENGNLTGITNALGETITISCDEKGRLLSLTKNGKTLTTNHYDKNGKLIRTEDPLKRARQTIYNETGLPGQIIQQDGSSIYLLYDQRGNLIKLTDPWGAATAYTYDDLNQVATSTDAENNTVSYRYDTAGRLTAVTDPAGNTRTYQYNESGKPTTIIDFDGETMTLSYSATGKPDCITDKEGKKTKRTYDLMGNLSEEFLPTGAMILHQYDKNNRLVKTLLNTNEEETETITTYAYDPAGNLLRKETGDGEQILAVSIYEYDACNRVRTVTDQAGGQTAYTYDSLTGKITAITDPAGNSRAFTYNEAGELIEETDIRGNKTTYTYTLLGKPATITDPSGRTTTHHYEQGGRLKQTNYPDGNTMIYTYDALGRVETKTDGNDYGLRYCYDAMGRIQTVTSTTGQEKSYTYDALGNVTAETDANGNETTYRYNSAGNLITHTDPLGNQTTYIYGQGSLLSQITQEGTGREEPRSTTYERNTLGQVTAVTDPLGHIESYTYDALGRIIKKTDKEGNDTEYTYTAFDKPERIQYADGTQVELQYTPLRQLARIKDWLGETTIQRNKQGDPISITDHTGTTISYEWGAYGERKNTVYPDGSTVRYEYDAMLRLKQMVTNDAANGWNTTTYQYDQLGRLKEKNLPGGVDTIWSYNEQGLPAQFTHQDQRGILDSYRFAYDAMGNKIEIQKKRQGLPEESGTYAYTYDTLNRLTGVEKDQKSLRSYAYDSFGNRTEMTDDKTGCKTAYTYNAGNQLLSEELWNTGANLPQPNIKKTYTYDNRGNITGEYRDDAILHTYTYNAMNRLAAADNETGIQAVYHYNGLGQRVGRNEETYLLDLTKPCQNLLGVKNGDQSQQFYWDFQPAAMRDERKNIRYFLNDELGSPLRLRYDTGKEDKYGYDEFGNDLFDPEAKDYINRYTRHGEIQPFGYTGYRYDDISGTYFAQAREYQPEKGRFTAEDVLRGNSAVPMTLNRYGYCWNQPLNSVDLNGKKPEKQYTLDPREDINGIGLMWDESGTKGTILYGNDATLDDAYAIIAIDKLNDNGASDEDIFKFIDSYREKKDNNTLIRSDKLIDYYTNIEDITIKLSKEMIKNEYEYKDDHMYVTWIYRLMEFRENVENKGPWDLKQLPEWNNSSLYMFDGEIVDRDAPGNIMYGYMGYVYGMPDLVLYLGASYAQLVAGTFKLEWLIYYPNSTLGDDPIDQKNIERGIKYLRKLHLDVNNINRRCLNCE